MVRFAMFRAMSPLLLVAACSSSTPPGAPASAPDSGGGDDSGADSAVVDSGGSGDTWTSWAKGFFAQYCTSCHGPSGSATPDFSVLANVVNDSAKIRCGVASTLQSGCGSSPYPPKQFPIGNGPKPTDAERARVVAWIEAGLPN
jgi:hypothetical protein